MRTRWSAIGLALLLIPACSADKRRVAGSPDESGDTPSSDSSGAGSGSSARPGAAGSSNSTNPGGGNQPGPSGSVPIFPGAGTGNGSMPLVGGMICDAVAGQHNTKVVKPMTGCLLAPNRAAAAATLEQVLECASGHDAVHLRLTFDPAFVDNTYGVNSIGWPHKRGHTFDRDLIKSDHAEIIVNDAAGAVAVRFKLDYVSADPSRPSGYGSLGVRGGDGAMEVGDPAWIVAWNTSISRNLNERGYASYTVDSPATDADYTPNPQAPEWDFRVVYEAWVDVAAFGNAGFGGATIEYVHASPAKGGEDTLHVKPGDCPCEPDDKRCTPPTTIPDGGVCEPDDPKCTGTGGTGQPDGGVCEPDDPKCTGTGGVGGSGGPDASVCEPDDPKCTGTGGVSGRPAEAPNCIANPSDPLCRAQ